MRAPHSLMAILALAAGLLVLEAPLATAGSYRPQMKRVSNAQAKRAPMQKEKAAVQPVGESVRVQGILRYAKGHLRINQTIIEYGPQTAMSLASDSRIDARALHGKFVTVFGTELHGNRLRAELIMAKDDAWSFKGVVTDPAEIPSPVDSRVGELDESAGS